MLRLGEQEKQEIFKNEWQRFRTKKDRSLELTSVAHECPPGRRKIAVKVPVERDTLYNELRVY